MVTKLTEEQVIALAWEAVKDFRHLIAERIFIRHYEHENMYRLKNVWLVWYRHINPQVLPAEFIVVVDDETGLAHMPPHC
jgi:hypothetical protein